MQNIAAPTAMKGTEMSCKKAHDLFGHAWKEMTMKIAKHLGFNAGAKDKNPCKNCMIGKAKQRDMPKKSDHQKSKKMVEQRFLDMSSKK